MIIKVSCTLVHTEYQKHLPQFLLNPYAHGLQTVDLGSLYPIVKEIVRPQPGEVLLFEYKTVGTLTPVLF